MRRKLASPASLTSSVTFAGLQRACACGQHTYAGECQACRSHRGFQQRPAVTMAPSIVQAALSSPGQPLAAATRHHAEASFGRDFSRVRIHTGRAAGEAASSVNRPGTITPLRQAVVQRDLARPPRAAPAPVRELTAQEIAAAITYNQDRFRDPYSIRLIRDVVGVAPLPAVVDEELVRAVGAWQAKRRMTQDGQIGHATTRSIFLELVAKDQLRDAIVMVMDACALPESRHLQDVRIGAGADCCGPADDADAVTSGGLGTQTPVRICFCRPRIPRTAANYDHFVRIVGHELVHVPQHAANVFSEAVREFEAWFWEACAEGRARRLTPAQRVAHAQAALGFFANIPTALRTPARIGMQNQLNALIAANGAGPC